MSYIYKVLESFPKVFYPMNSVVAGEGQTGGYFTDFSGNSTNATIVGTPPTALPLVSGTGNSFVLNTTNNFYFTPGIFISTSSVKRPFTLEAWFKDRSGVAATMQIVGHDSTADGLTWNGDAVSFTTSHAAAGTCSVSYYPPDISGAMLVHGVHTESKNQLYVNGELVGETELTAAQILAGYTTPSNPTRLYSGQILSGTGTITIDSVAVYDRILSTTEINDHFTWGRRVVDIRQGIFNNNGRLWTFLDSDADVLMTKDFIGQDDWMEGEVSQIYVTDELEPSFNNSTTSVAGTWSYGLLLEGLAATIQGSKIEWTGDGSFTVESSIDNGSNWSTCVNGREIVGIGANFSTTGKTLIIRVSFPSGLSNTSTNNVTSLSVKLYNSRSVIGFNSPRKFVMGGNVALSSAIRQPIEMHNEMGLDAYSGYATLAADTDAVPVATRTVEMWFKFNATPTAGSTVFDLRTVGGDTSVYVTTAANMGLTPTGGTLYINGATYASGTALTLNQWYYLVFVASADNFKNLTLGAKYDGTSGVNCSFGSVALYSTALTLQNTLDMFNGYFYIPVLTLQDPGLVSLTEDTPAAKIYTSTWTNSS